MSFPPSSQPDPLSVREKIINAAAAFAAILVLGLLLRLFPLDGLTVPLLASMGASAFLLFVIPHSPMAQPWPLIGGHLGAALVAVVVGHFAGDAVLSAAAGVGASVLVMQLLRCLHPPAAATALAVALSDARLDAAALIEVGVPVIAGTLVLLLFALVVNNLLLGRRYPMRDSHHPHHEEFQAAHARDPLRLEEADIAWALEHMDGIVDASKQDLIDIYELALDHAIERKHSIPGQAKQQESAGQR